ncbi:ABC transporter substrate-binding protein [Flavimaribacter sediminis]|uniref:ABC transporter substrate-binding protein n=1 Tax=Flavimaribacter sediminis TaxID=2865987 RepID=UPI00215D80B6|nr:sugar ABC transporter substrate-binding protein [Flavimaribacter sediminis]
MKIRIHELLAGAALAGALSFGLSAHAEGLGTPDDPVEIHMLANEAFANQWQQNMVPEFNKAYPNIKVVIDGVPYSELLAKSLLDATGPDPRYDILIADDPWVPQLAEAGVLLDLKGDEVAGWTADDYEWDDFYAAPLAASEWKDVQYGVPLRSNLLLMFVNKSIYEAADLPAPTPELTWEDYLEQAPKLVMDRDGNGQADTWAIDTYFTRDALTPTIWQTIMNSNGGKLLTDDGKAAFNDETGVEALKTHIKLLDFAPPGAVSHGFNESLQAFRQGQTATMFMWGSVFKGTAVSPETTTLTPDEVGIQIMPVGSKTGGAHRGIWSGTINNKSENRQAAWALLEWLSSKEGEQWHANTLGVFPARKSTLDSTPDSEWMAPVFVALKNGYSVAGEGGMWRPRTPKSDAVQQVLADEVARAIAGQITPEEALDTAADRVNDVLN